MKKLILVLFLTASSSFAGQFTGTYNTDHIRTMWSVCFETTMKRNPGVDPFFEVQVCDCILDLTRKRFTFKELNARDNNTEWFTQATHLCRTGIYGNTFH